MNSYLVNQNLECCSGCGACIQICPKQCISFIDVEDGFSAPKIDEEKCIHCNRCVGVCPYSNPVERYCIIKSFSAKAKSVDAQMLSSSGGCFYGLSRVVMDQGGVVFGAVIDDSYHCVHKMATKCEELDPLLGSKYVQSRCDVVFSEIKNKLQNGKTLLFSGTPCQVAGLKNYLGKNYDNLLLVDVACHGVPSNNDFLKCIQWIENKHNGKLIYIKFRDKSNAGWMHSLTYKIEKNGTIKSYTVSPYKIPYYYFFLYSKNIRKSCYECPYIGTERVGDITLGDFWAAERVVPEKDIGKGISIALCNTQKGLEWIKKSKKYLNLQLIDKELAVRNNQPFSRKPDRYLLREKMLKQVLGEGYKNTRYYLGLKEFIIEAIKALVPEKIKRMIIRLLGDKK